MEVLHADGMLHAMQIDGRLHLNGLPTPITEVCGAAVAATPSPLAAAITVSKQVIVLQQREDIWHEVARQ